MAEYLATATVTASGIAEAVTVPEPTGETLSLIFDASRFAGFPE
ncbi:hypothetical protein [Sphaerotilus sp.]